MPHLIDVPNFDAIEIHWGNTADDTDACTLVGQQRSANFIGSSRAAFDALYPKLEAADVAGGEIWVTYSNQPATDSQWIPPITEIADVNNLAGGD